MSVEQRQSFPIQIEQVIKKDTQTNSTATIEKVYYRGFRYVHEMLKMLPEIPEPILLAKIFATLTSLGRIHPASTHAVTS